MPVSLQRIFINVNNWDGFDKKHTELQLKSLEKQLPKNLVLAYLFQYYVANAYQQTGILLLPNEIEYIDQDLGEKAKQKLKLYYE